MKKILFLWAVLFCLGTTAYGYPSVTSGNGNELSDGVHNYSGTLSVTALNGITTSYTGKKVSVSVDGNQADFVLLRVPLGAVGAIRLDIQTIAVDQATGVIPGRQGIGVVAFNVALPGNVYGNTLTDQTCDFEFDVLGSGTDDFIRFRYVGVPTD